MQKNYKLPHKRRKEKKTDYKQRLALLKSNKDRVVIRRTNKHILGQIVKYEKDGDKVVVSVHSSVLKGFGWEKNCGNIPAAYLTGLLLGKKAQEKGVKEGVMDIGLQISSNGSRIYAFLKGVVDSGMKVNHSEEILPKEDRLKGKHIDDKIEKDIENVRKKIMK